MLGPPKCISTLMNSRLVFGGAPVFILFLLVLIPDTGRCFLNPTTGRWLSRDPLTETGGNNLYSFAHNDSQGAFDPDGRITVRVLTDQPLTCCGSADVKFNFI